MRALAALLAVLAGVWLTFGARAMGIALVAFGAVAFGAIVHEEVLRGRR